MFETTQELREDGMVMMMMMKMMTKMTMMMMMKIKMKKTTVASGDNPHPTLHNFRLTIH